MQKAHAFIFAFVLAVLGLVVAAGPAPASAEEGAKPAACAAETAGACKATAGERAASGCCAETAACCEGGGACCASHAR